MRPTAPRLWPLAAGHAAVAITAGPVQALAAMAVAAALAGSDALPWCLALGAASVLRATGAYAMQVWTAGVQATWSVHLHAVAGAAAGADGGGRIGAAVAASGQGLRSAGEWTGLWLGAGLVCAWAGWVVLAAWLAALPVVLWAVRRPVAWRPGLRAARLAAGAVRDWHATVAAAPLLRALGVNTAAVARDGRVHAAAGAAMAEAAPARLPGLLLMGAVGSAQAAVALVAIAMAVAGTCPIAAAIAAIIATTTAAARSDLLVQALAARSAWRQALRGLPPAEAPAASVATPAGGRLALAGEAGYMLRPGRTVALLGSPRVEAALAGVLRGAGDGAVLGLPGGTLLRSSAGAAWRQAVAVVAPGDPLFAGTLRENLDPAGGAGDAALAQVLALVGIDAARLGPDRVIGPGGSGLSGGEAHRLAVARALVARPAALVLIDPCRHLDAVSAAAVHALLRAPPQDLIIVVLGADPATAAACGEVAMLACGGARRGPSSGMLVDPAVRQLLQGRAA